MADSKPKSALGGTITVWGEEIALPVKDGLPIADISSDMDQVASQMGYWASVWAAAEREAEEVDAHYRRWRAQRTAQALEEDPKLAEWKVKALVESDPKFIQLKTAAAKCQEAIVAARGAVDSFDKKANALQSKGAMMRKELDATGMTTPVEPRSAPAARPRYEDDDENESAGPEVRERREARVRDIFNKKKGKKNNVS